MLSGTILDAGIAIVFLFLLVSLVVTAVNESIAALLVSRAKWLQRGVERLLTSAVTKDFYEHPLIKGSSSDQGLFRTYVLRGLAGSGPSYIPSRTFALTLLDVVANAEPRIAALRPSLRGVLDNPALGRGPLKTAVRGLADAVNASDDLGKRIQADLRLLADSIAKVPFDTVSLADRLRATAQALTAPTAAEAKAALLMLASAIAAEGGRIDIDKSLQQISEIGAMLPKDTDSAAVNVELGKILGALRSAAGVDDHIKAIEAAVAALPDRYVRSAIIALPDSALKKTLLVLLEDAQGSVERLKESIEIWFNAAMDRVGGWYKRRTHLVVLIIAAIVTIGLNVDTLLILQTLQSQASLRDAIVGKAKAFSEHPPAGTVVTPAAGQGTGPTPPVAGPGQSPELFDDDKLRSLHAQIDGLGLPIGWFNDATACVSPTIPGGAACARMLNHQQLPTLDTAGLITSWGHLRFHALGWLLTIIAASLGAPFWFDMLNKVISIRSVGRSPEEAQKAPKKVPAPLEPGQSPKEAAANEAMVRG
jgi:hypothetical protein